jgi:hypothetical protein
MRVSIPLLTAASRGLAVSLVGGLALLGCQGGAKLTSSDVRIDKAGPDDEVESTDPRMCTTPNGGVYVVWADDREGVSKVWMNRSVDRGGAWLNQAVPISGGEGNASLPDIACNADGVFVTWQDDRAGEVENGNIYYQASFDGGANWLAEAIQLDEDEDGDTNSRAPRIAAVGRRVSVTWFDSYRGGYDIFVTTANDGQIFAAPIRLDVTDDAGASYSAWPQIQTDGANAVYVVWEDSRNGNSDIYFAGSYDAGVRFDPDLRLDLGDMAGQFNSFSPRFAARGSRVYVVWSDERNGDARDILMNWSPNRGLTWATSAIRVDSDPLGFSNSRFPDVALDDAGAAYIAWEDDRNGGYDVFFRRSVDGNFAVPEERLDRDSPGAGNSLRPRVAVQDTTVVVAWEDRRADFESVGYNDLYYNHSLDGGAVWAADLRIDSIEPATSYKVDLNLALDAGQIFAAWADGRRGNQDVFFHRLAVGEEAEYVRVNEQQP